MYPEWMKDRSTVSAVLVGGAFLLYFLYKKYSKAPIKVPPEAVAVGTVKSLFIYPVKSLAALSVDTARCVTEGLMTNDNDDVRDRAWMIVNDRGVFLSQRAEPKLVLLRVSVPFGGDMLHIDGPGCPTLKVSKYLSSRNSEVVNVSVWGSPLQGVDCGQEPADWMSAYLGKSGFRLVYLPPDMSGRKVIENKCQADKAFNENDKVIYADAAPILVMSENTINDINGRLKDVTISERNFRPNIYVSLDKPYDEDTWADVYIGQAKMTNVRLCDRCTFPTVDPDKGKKNKDQEPIRTLRTYRPGGNDPFLGIYTNVIKHGNISVGDTIYVTKKNT